MNDYVTNLLIDGPLAPKQKRWAQTVAQHITATRKACVKKLNSSNKNSTTTHKVTPQTQAPTTSPSKPRRVKRRMRIASGRET